jgi:photosystem II stability/assembly factor-like uncharacterized protein
VAFISGDAGKVLKTTNGGGSWTNIAASPIPTTMGLDVVRAIDANTVIVAGTPAATFVYKTTNSGTTWTQVFTQTGGYIDDIKFKDANNGFMYGDPVGSRWSLWKTTNGGTTWDSTGLYLAQAAAEAGWDNAMCVQGNNIWFGTNAAHIYRSTNFGASWISTPTASLAQSTSITVSGNIGFVTGSGVSMKTTDAGATWSAFTNPYTSADIHFQSLGSRFWIAETNMYYSTDNGTTFPLSYTYGTLLTGPMWNIGANVTGTALTVYVTGYAGGIWKYTETVAATPTWTEQISGVTGALYSVSAVDDNIAWACGDAGKVVKTTNGGSTWVNVSGNLPTTALCYNIYAFDANLALLTASPAAGAYIYKTTNGGTNWTQTFFQASAFGDGLWMASATNAYFYGDPVAGNWLLKKSTDGGSTWVDWATVPTTATGGWNNAHCVNGNNIWIGSNSSNLLYSSNYGTNWSTQTTTLANEYSIWFNSATNGLVAEANLNKTTNTGLNWTALTNPGTTISGGLVGTGSEYWYCNQAQIVYYSSNEGATWASQYTAPTAGGVFYHMTRSRSGNTIWGVRSLGGISRYGSPLSGITPIVTITPSDYRLEQNYPNPFNPATKITFALPKSGLVTLRVYDISGREITTLLNSSLNVGTYSYEFNGANLSSGVYFYKLEANGFSAVKKMMLIK